MILRSSGILRPEPGGIGLAYLGVEMRKNIKNSFVRALFVATLLSTGFAMADAPSGRNHGESAGWVVVTGATLEGTLRDWTAREGWALVWESQRDYRFRASASLGPDFLSAVRDLADAISQTSPDLTVTLYLGNRVVHVRDTGLTPN